MTASAEVAMNLIASLRLDHGALWGDCATDWQRRDVEAVLDMDSSTPYLWCGRPRGGAKTGDAAAVGIAMLLTQAPLAARLYAVAADADQAGLLVDAIRGFVLRAPALGEHLRVDARKVTAVRSGATLEVVPADEASAYGLKPWAIIADELAQWPTTSNAKGVWAALISALPKVPGARLLVLTSAGDPAHWSHKVREQALRSKRWRVSEQPGPCPWIDRVALEEQKSLLTESQFARLHLNRWTTGEDRLTTPEQVRACVGHSGPLEPVAGHRYVLGLDVGLVGDRTVLTAAHLERRAERAAVVVDRQWVWQGSKAQPVNLGDVEAVTYEAARAYRASLVADPFQAVHLCQRLRSRGVRVREFTFSGASVGRLALTLYRLLRDAALDLDGDDAALLDELCRVRLVETAPGAYRIDHDPAEHDDRVISLALAAHALVETGQPRPATTSSAAGVRVPAMQRSWTERHKAGARRVGRFVVPNEGYRPPEREGRW